MLTGRAGTTTLGAFSWTWGFGDAEEAGVEDFLLEGPGPAMFFGPNGLNCVALNVPNLGG